MQEFSYDTLKSIKSSELTIPDGLTLVLPQDYVNYVRVSFKKKYFIKVKMHDFFLLTFYFF